MRVSIKALVQIVYLELEAGRSAEAAMAARQALERDDEAISDYALASGFLSHVTYANARMFLIQRGMGRNDQARATLADARRRVPADSWLAKIFSSLAGELTPEQLVAAATDPKQLCEAYYYAGEVSLIRGERAAAAGWFRECVGTGMEVDPDEPRETMSEYQLAEWRLGG